MYELACVYGIIEVKYSSADLEPYPGTVNVDLAKIAEMKKISLRQACNLVANREQDAVPKEVTCNCNGPCLDNQCKCAKANKKCSSHCHIKSTKKICENEDEIL
jgi:topoisomerase IA-like protein